MKNKLLLILAILVSFLTINVVKAEGPFYLDWDTKKESYAYETTPYKDGYLTLSYDYLNNHDAEYLRHYDYQGNIIKEREFVLDGQGDYSVYALTTDGENIYVIAEKYTITSNVYYYYYEFWQLDEELNTVASLELPNDFSSYWPTDYENVSAISIEDNKIYILKDHLSMYVINKDLSTYETKRVTEALVKQHFSEIYYSEDIFNSIHSEEKPLIFGISSKKDDNIVVAYNKYDWVCHDEVAGSSNPNPPASLNPTKSNIPNVGSKNDGYKFNGDYYPECISFYLALYNTAEGEIWTINPEGYYGARDVEIIDDYILVAVDGEENNPILVYNLEGNLIQTIESKNYYTSYGFISGTDGSFITSNICYTGTYGVSSGNLEKGEPMDYDSCTERHQVYSLKHEIETKVEGKGSIRVNSSAKTHTSVSFEIIPDDGYVLSEVKVKDAAGNIININDYTFTMPSSDVIIEAVFVLAEIAPAINPETSDIAIVLILAATIFSIICVVRSYKRLIFLK